MFELLFNVVVTVDYSVQNRMFQTEVHHPT